MTMPESSRWMRLFNAIGLSQIAWSLRRLYCPVSKEALVLEVGSGGNPYPRANVLLDAYEETRERHWVPLMVDRPFVLGFVENLPFRDKCFDFVIASHVLEHSAQPEKFLSELQRVAKAGYIEVPDAFLERINPYRDHRLEITLREQKLVIRKKPAWIVEPETVELYEHKAKSVITGRAIPAAPFAFHVRYYWQSEIDFEILNPGTDASWEPIDDTSSTQQSRLGLIARSKGKVLAFLRARLSQAARNRRIDLLPMLRCTECGNPQLERINEELVCPACQAHYEVKNGIPIMYSASEKRGEQ